jgi:hypothetical protein
MSQMVRVKQARDVEFQYDAPGGMTCQILTDMTGSATQGALAVAATLVFPATAGRQTYTLPLFDFYFTQIQFKVASTGRVILLAGLLRVLDVGCFFFGQNGEIWDSTPLSIGL